MRGFSISGHAIWPVLLAAVRHAMGKGGPTVGEVDKIAVYLVCLVNLELFNCPLVGESGELLEGVGMGNSHIRRKLSDCSFETFLSTIFQFHKRHISETLVMSNTIIRQVFHGFCRMILWQDLVSPRHFDTLSSESTCNLSGKSLLSPC